MAKLTPQEIAGYARGAGFPADQIPTAVAVALAESGGDPAAVNSANRNGSVDYGLWQINTVHGALLQQGNKFDPAANAKMALSVYRGAGSKWTPWSVYNSRTYLTYMPQGTLAAAAPTTVQNTPGPVAIPGADPGQAIPAVTQATPISGLSDTLLAIPRLIATLLSGGFWLRIGAFMLGCILVMFSVIRLSGAERLAKTGAKVAVSVASKGVL
jgi:hypothetical protein